MSISSDSQTRFDVYGTRIDGAALKLLSRNSYDMYGMMRYFMGYADDQFAPFSGSAGKRFRPSLLLCIADAFGVAEQALPVALSIEIFHNFTLIHDDVVDHDELRRGRPTVWKVWGVDHAINTGDAQLVLALLALEEGELPTDVAASLRRRLLSCYLEVAEGQYLDFSFVKDSVHDAKVTKEKYLTMIGKKSAALIAISAASAGIIAGREVREVEALHAFGFNLGMAYQLHDDVQSIWGDTHITGKEAHGDLRERKKTLPVIRARDELKGSESEEFRRLYDSTESTAETDERIFELIEGTTARAYAETTRNTYKLAALAALPATGLTEDARGMLTDLTERLVPTQEVSC